MKTSMLVVCAFLILDTQFCFPSLMVQNHHKTFKSVLQSTTIPTLLCILFETTPISPSNNHKNPSPKNPTKSEVQRLFFFSFSFSEKSLFFSFLHCHRFLFKTLSLHRPATRGDPPAYMYLHYYLDRTHARPESALASAAASTLVEAV